MVTVEQKLKSIIGEQTVSVIVLQTENEKLKEQLAAYQNAKDASAEPAKE